MSLFRRQKSEEPRTYVVDVFPDNMVDQEWLEYRPGVTLRIGKRGWSFIIQPSDRLPIIGDGYEQKEHAIETALAAVQQDREE